MSSGKPKDFQRTVELINKYILNSTQFMNRFVASVDVKLGRASRQLQRLEAQVILLERKLDSIDNDGAPPEPKEKPAPAPLAIADKPAAAASSTTAGGAPALPPGVSAPAGQKAPPAMGRKGKGGAPPPLPPGVAAPAQNAPPPMANGGRGGAPPPPPGAKMPPLPPGVSAGGPAPLALMPPPMPGAPGVAPGMPPPPPPMAAAGAGITRNHPRLQGYFKMADAGVPVVAIKQKMKSDGHNPDWFDTPDAPAPLPPVKANANGKTDYDSD